ncbi:hypothetical protein V7457_23380 [Bacillus toyonensis]|uniref:hypothetical protein n=1 Tax=Bacillus TaxID=1386 RepID=UPI000BEC0B23|nr:MULTISPECIES: hypothetical protein [Bacillus]KAF6547535.1 hypothetical protein G9F74_27515 [Bacillus sp. EKM202B]MBJ8068083.1 hypothetical protein [Bacillus cereus group sp. N15]MCS3600777.1 acetylornithine/succinyldiaminopimelate/putrescine aminotransferase [Bacillus sp. JUb91]PDY53008.1 hypothetical protein CON61_12210 [Bacillus toyonensis]PEI92668.1 hypothetical protein CN671_31060 [Bacillus toyonensis]
MKKLLLLIGVATILLGACSENKSTKQNKEQAENLKMEKKKEQNEMVSEDKEYIVTKIKNDIIYLEDVNHGKSENTLKINKYDIIATSWKGPKRNGSIDVGDYVSFEKTTNNQYKAIITKDIVGEIKYDGTIKYKIIEVNDKAVKWLPLNKENNGGNVPPEMIKIVNDKKIKVGNIVTIKETNSNPQELQFELTIIE